jgi:hypothetical protein
MRFARPWLIPLSLALGGCANVAGLEGLHVVETADGGAGSGSWPEGGADSSVCVYPCGSGGFGGFGDSGYFGYGDSGYFGFGDSGVCSAAGEACGGGGGYRECCNGACTGGFCK